MATLATQTIQDGERNVVIRGTITSADTTNLNGNTLVDVSGLSGFGVDWTEVKVIKFQGAATGMAIDLEWNATANVLIGTVPEQSEVNRCYKHFGGLTNNAGAGKNGDILISTTGVGAGDTGEVTLTLRKHRQ